MEKEKEVESYKKIIKSMINKSDYYALEDIDINTILFNIKKIHPQYSKLDILNAIVQCLKSDKTPHKEPGIKQESIISYLEK